jgi:two-component system response regulator YesN
MEVLVSMRNILILDDEKNIRLGLKAMIERKYLTYYNLYLASTVKEALIYFDNNKIDIVITDIRMPDEDGIAFMKKLKERNIKTNIIVLSGYDDFNYAVESLRYGAKDYLLKPINREELYKTIDKIEENIKQNEYIENQSSSEEFEEFRAAQLNYIFLNSHINEEDIEKICSKIKMDIFDKGYYVGVINNKRYSQCINDKELFGIIKDTIKEYEKTVNEKIIILTDGIGNIVIIGEEFEVFKCLESKISTKNHMVYAIGLSEKQFNINKIREGYLQAIEALKYTFLYNNHHLLSFSSIKDKLKNYELPIDKIKKISNMIGTDRENEIRGILKEVLDIKEITKYDISYLEGINKAINEFIFSSAIKKLDGDTLNKVRGINKIGDIFNYENFIEYFHAVEELIICLNDYTKQIMSIYADNPEMKRAVQYIHENFNRDINMAMVSNYVSLNYSYFSQAFKEYTGYNFVDYLKKIRIEKAKELLENFDYKIYEVGEMVGYKNSKQFAKTFREMEGISPIEYRNRLIMR